MNNRILIKNPLIVTANPLMDVFHGDILIEGSRITQLGPDLNCEYDSIINASSFIVVPGFIQTHVHLCQVLFRNLADDLSLLSWLREKIWPFEGAHSASSMQASARLGIAELIKSGTTTILDMGTVNHQDTIFEELAQSGLRAFSGKAMMDLGEYPQGLQETTAESISESNRLLEKWHNYDGGRLKYAYAPRFALSCSDDLLTETANLARQNKTLYHTHAAENRDEIQHVNDRFGVSNIRLFEKLGIAGENLCLAHCVWADTADKQILREHGINVLHCPSANMKLASGIAPIPDYLDAGIKVSLGADGAPCNNNLDIFNEMRLAALIQKINYGPQAMPAETVFKMATINGAKCLDLENEIGSIEQGKLADLTFIKKDQVHSIPYDNIYSKLIYSTRASDVQHVMVGGQWLLKDGQLQTMNEQEVVHSVSQTIESLKIT